MAVLWVFVAFGVRFAVATGNSVIEGGSTGLCFRIINVCNRLSVVHFIV